MFTHNTWRISFVYVCVREGEGERQKERQTEKEREREGAKGSDVGCNGKCEALIGGFRSRQG